MLITLTPNPSLDLLFTADRLVWDDANRLESPRRRAGGQGINVARAGRALGAPVLAVAPLGGAVGRELSEMLAAEGTPLRAVPIEGETRVFVGVAERMERRSLLLNPRGPLLSTTEADALAEAALEAVAEAVGEGGGAWLACCGSLPPGLDDGFYAGVLERARSLGARCVPDCDGAALRAAAPRADMLVPNRHEAERLLELSAGSIDGPAAAADAASAMADEFGADVVAVTMGAEGAVLVTGGERWHCAPPAGRAEGSAVGAGDAFLAALLGALSGGRGPAESLAAGVGAGSAVLRSTGAAILDAGVAVELAGAVRPRRL